MILGNPILVDSSFYITLLQAKADPLAWLEARSAGLIRLGGRVARGDGESISVRTERRNTRMVFRAEGPTEIGRQITSIRPEQSHDPGQGLYDYDFATCGIVWMEVLRGRSDPRLRDRFERFFQTAVFINQSPATWERIARLTWELDRKGVVLPATDLAIAACALEHDVPILTFDKHFRSIPGVLVLDTLPS